MLYVNSDFNQRKSLSQDIIFQLMGRWNKNEITDIGFYIIKKTLRCPVYLILVNIPPHHPLTWDTQIGRLSYMKFQAKFVLNNLSLKSKKNLHMQNSEEEGETRYFC